MLSFGIISSSTASGGGVTDWAKYSPTGTDYQTIIFGGGTAVGFKASGGGTSSYYASNVETALTDVGATTANADLFYENGAFYQVGAVNFRRIIRSTTGTSWSTVLNVSATGDNIYGLAFGGGVFVAPVYTDNDVYTSTSGTAWTEQVGVLAAGNWTDATWNLSVFGVYQSARTGLGGATTAYYTSTNGTTWTARTLPSTPASNVIAGSAVVMYLNPGGVAYTSSSGTAFALAGTAGVSGTKYLAYGSGVWVALGASGGLFQARYSNDNGVTWGTAPFLTGGTASSNYDLAYNSANNSFYIINDAGSTSDIYKASVVS